MYLRRHTKKCRQIGIQQHAAPTHDMNLTGDMDRGNYIRLLAHAGILRGAAAILDRKICRV